MFDIGTGYIVGAIILEIKNKVKMNIGDKHNMLTLIDDKAVKINRSKYKLFRCDCGNEKLIRVNVVSSGHVKSCGCLRRLTRVKKYDHPITVYKKFIKEKYGKPLYEIKEYKIWVAIKTRCYNPKANRYYIYGGRGIKMCDRWLESFHNFYDDMGARPSDKHSIDRIDTNGDYEPGNCRWVTSDVQNKNKRVDYHECEHCKRIIGQKSNYNKHMNHYNEYGSCKPITKSNLVRCSDNWKKLNEENLHSK
jgi:hypothetical protein